MTPNIPLLQWVGTAQWKNTGLVSLTTCVSIILVGLADVRKDTLLTNKAFGLDARSKWGVLSSIARAKTG